MSSLCEGPLAEIFVGEELHLASQLAVFFGNRDSGEKICCGSHLNDTFLSTLQLK